MCRRNGRGRKAIGKSGGTARPLLGLPDLWADGNRGTHELRSCGDWVIGVTVRLLEGVEGGTLVSGQWDTVLDTQWQVGLESKQTHDSTDYSSTEERKLTLEM